MDSPLNKMKNRLEKILDQTLDCVFTFDEETLLFNYVNEGAMRQTGYSEEELFQMTPLDIKPEFTQGSFQKLLQSLIDGTKSRLIFQTIHRHKQGHDISVEIFLQYVLLADDRPSFVAIVRDISERIEIEKALKESEEQFRALAHYAPVGIFKTDASGGCTYVNKRWSEITGLSFADAQGDGWVSVLHPEDMDGVSEHWRQLVDNDNEFFHEYRFLRPNKTVSFVSGQAHGLYDSNQRKVGYIGTIVDVTERRVLEEQRQLMERKLQDTQKLESLGLLAGGIAHDFNNLLTGIMGNASLASIELPTGSPVQDHLVRINDGSVRAADLCKQLLAYSGKGRFIVKNLSLNQIIQETMHLLHISISKKAVLSSELYEDIPAIEADPTQIRQILMNLVINASEAIGDFSGVISITTGLTRVDREYLGGTVVADELPEGTYASLEVSDTGCGMSPDVLAKVFDPFFTTKFTGRGLGLAAAIGIVRGHKGTIKVYSEEGRGTTFKLLFPIVLGKAELPVQKSATDGQQHRGKGCVLIVDDEESIRSTVAQMVQKLGYSLELAADGRKAVEMFRENPGYYRIVLMDLTMPHMNGEIAYAEMRKLNPDTPIVLMSGFNQERAISRFKGKGLAGFIEKPFNFSTLTEVMNRVLPSVD